MVPSATLNTMPKPPPPQLRVFALKGFARFARRMHVSDEALWGSCTFSTRRRSRRRALQVPNRQAGGRHAVAVGRWLR